MKSLDMAGLLEKLRTICLALPEVVEHIDGFGHNTFIINGKSVVISGENKNGFGISLKSDRETQALLLQKEKFFKNTIYWAAWMGVYPKSS